jgi:hypothetical protein
MGESAEEFVEWMPLGLVVPISCGAERIVDDADIVMFGGPIDSTHEPLPYKRLGRP